MKETFTPPVCELIIFENEDVITASYLGQEIYVDKVGDEVDLPEIDLPAIDFPAGRSAD